MLFRKKHLRKTDDTSRKMQVESLEGRRLLSGDGIAPDPDALIAAGGFVSGIKWEDSNLNGQQDASERGLAGVTIYADMNGNGTLELNEPSVITQRDNPNTRFDEGGRYELFVPPGEHVIREVVPSGYVQTFPAQHEVDQRRPEIDPSVDPFSTVQPSFLEIPGVPEDVFTTEVAITIHPTCVRPYELDVVAVSPDGEPDPEVGMVVSHEGPILNGCGGDTSIFTVDIIGMAPMDAFEIGFMDLVSGEIVGTIPVEFEGHRDLSGGHFVEVNQGDRISNLNFGNARTRPASGGIEGRKWLDRNGDGEWSGNEPGLGGVTVYLDTNNNGQLDRSERTQVTQFDDPFTDFDEGGLYQFGQLRPGDYTVREVIPEGYAQTFPLLSADVISSETGSFQDGGAWGFDVSAVSFATQDAVTTTTIEMTVSWPNGCGEVLDGQTSHTVIGNTVLVDVQGQGAIEGEICTLATKVDTIEVSVEGLSAGNYTVVGTLNEGDRPTLGVVGEIEVGASGFHLVTVNAGESVADVNFGNRQTGGGESISGTKWNDKNGDGFRQRDEPGLGGVTIYLDVNGNAQLDKGEPSTVSSLEEANFGSYTIGGLTPGSYQVREVVPAGYRQTSPAVWDFEPETQPGGEQADPFLPPEFRPFPGASGAHFVWLEPGAQLEGLDFGNQATTPGSISGTKWLDSNGNGERDEDEIGLAGVTIFVDANFNRTLDEGELSVVSGEEGEYQIDGVKPGRYSIQEVVPEGYRQTFPMNFWLGQPNSDIATVAPRIIPEFSGHIVNVIAGGTVEGIDFGNQQVKLGSITGLKWFDADGDGVQGEEEPGLAGVTIYLDANFNGRLDEGETSVVSQKDNPDTAENEEGRYTLDGIAPLQFHTVREVIPEGYEQTFPHRLGGFDRPTLDLRIADPFVPFPLGFHAVYVDSGQMVEGINFGNRKLLEPGVISGIKWEDLDGDGERDRGERGLPGFRIFVDANRNGRFDRGEFTAVTERDNPDTPEDESGRYAMKVRPGSHLVLEQQQRGYEQTYPNTARRVMFPFNLGQVVNVEAGETTTGVDFGNKPVPEPAVLSGVKWFDLNANGVFDRGEEPIPGVTIYLDANDNGRLDRDEVSTITGGQSIQLIGEDPLVPFPRGGYYSFDVEPGDYVIREVVPRGYIQTYPIGAYELGESVTTTSGRGLAVDMRLASVEASSSSADDSGQTETLLTFESLWASNEAEVFVESVRVEEGVISVQLRGIAIDPDLNVETVQETSVRVTGLEFGEYEVTATLAEDPISFADEEVEFPLVESRIELQAEFAFAGDDAHRVSVVAGEFAGGLNFGNIAVPDTGGADSNKGDDPHSELHDDTATLVEFYDGHARVNSYVDTAGDMDVFRFVSEGHTIVGEGGRMDGGEALSYELLDAGGNRVAASIAGQPIEAVTTLGETYYLRVAGSEGQYQLDLFEETREVLDLVPGDVDGNRRVDFEDFLKLSANFGKQVDQAFADGDFDEDNAVTFADFLVLSANFGNEF